MEASTHSIWLPFLMIGFKTYIQATGKNALKMAQSAAKASNETGISIVPIPQFTDIAMINEKVHLPVFAQHVDPIKPGSHTGYVLPEAVKAAGAVGTLINHSEKRLQLDEIEKTVERTRQVGLISCVCSDTPELSEVVAGFAPDIILIENPELIGTGRAVSNTDPEVVRRSLKLIKDVDPDVHVVCGAGITNGKDVAAALRLGVVGVGAASAIVKAADPYAVMAEMAMSLKSEFRGECVLVSPRSP